MLLTEHNKLHQEKNDGKYTSSELKAYAGGINALRLISDVSGISLENVSADKIFPSFRTSELPDLEKTRASLSRRVFRSLQDEVVDYGHRVPAEYLAAHWLAQRISEGFPLSRVRALIGVDGTPAPELRGLHAWLATIDHVSAPTLIDSDPYGVLVYGDVSTFPAPLRRRLLDGLARLAEEEPFFHSADRLTSPIGGLSKDHMTEQFRDILVATPPDFALASLVLDALSVGEPNSKLLHELIGIVFSQQVYGLRYRALKALLNLGETGEEALSQRYDQLGQSESDIRMRSDIISRIYSRIGPDKVASLLNEVADRGDEDLVGGALYSVTQSITPKDAECILGKIRQPNYKDIARKNSFEVRYTIERLIELLVLQGDEITDSSLWLWLTLWKSYRHSYGIHESQILQKAFRERPDALAAVVRSFAEGSSDISLNSPFSFLLREIVSAEDEDRVLHDFAATIFDDQLDTERRKLVLQLVIRRTFELGSSDARKLFDELSDFADENPDFQPVFNENRAWPIPPWRKEDALERAQRSSERSAGLKKSIQDFKETTGAIRAGEHIGWLNWLARLYYSDFDEEDGIAAPKIAEMFGQDGFEIASEGLRASFRRADVPTIDRISDASFENSYPVVWRVYQAGMDELWRVTPDIASIPTEVLKVAIALDLVWPIAVNVGNEIKKTSHSWKKSVLEKSPNLIKDVYVYMAERSFERGSLRADGLYELLNTNELSEYSAEVAVHFLQKFPNAPHDQLASLIVAALQNDEARTKLAQISREKQHWNNDKFSDEQKSKWLAAAYLLVPGDFAFDVRVNDISNELLFWTFRELSGRHWRQKRSAYPLAPEQIEFIATLGANTFPASSMPTGGSYGDRNAWDASDFIRALVNELSTITTVSASEALDRLNNDAVMASYGWSVKQAVAHQRGLIREARFRRPTWDSAVAALMRGRPANAADLHALVVDHIDEIALAIRTKNQNLFRQFWNLGPSSQLLRERIEDSCRDILAEKLEARLAPLGLSVEPEGRYVQDKRADIVVQNSDFRIPIELKRDSHADLWTAAENQLGRLYTPDPRSEGFGVYGVFWFGPNRQGKPTGRGGQFPSSASQLRDELASTVPVLKSNHISVRVIDVSGELPSPENSSTKTGKPKQK